MKPTRSDESSGKEITMIYLFLAAGSIGTTALLVKARESGSLPKLNAEVRDGWWTNGNVLFTRTVNELTGKHQGGPVIKSILDYENTQTHATIESIFFPIGVDCNCLMKETILCDLKAYFLR